MLLYVTNNNVNDGYISSNPNCYISLELPSNYVAVLNSLMFFPNANSPLDLLIGSQIQWSDNNTSWTTV